MAYNPAPRVSREELGLSKVENTADLEKPVSAAVQRELDAIWQRIGPPPAPPPE